MQSSQGNLVLRTDTLLGVCEALGEDFGFNPVWLRIAFAVALLLNPTVVISTYLAIGVVVMLVRLLMPNPRRAARQKAAATATATASAEPARSEASHVGSKVEQRELAVAA